MRLCALPVAMLFAGLAAGQTFDIASVKPGKPGSAPSMNFPLGPGDVYVPNGGLFAANNLPLATYIFFAYKVIGNQGQFLLPQLPDWAKTEQFDIQARAEGNPGKDQMRMMMRALLADRFKLAIHNEDREIPVLAFVLSKPGKLGPKLMPHDDSVPCSTSSEPAPAVVSAATLPNGLPVLCNGIFGVGKPTDPPGHIRIAARNVTIGFIADSLSAAANLGRPMVDKTGLTGTFDFTFEFTLENQSQPGADPSADASPLPIQEALRDQFGIKLQSDKSTVKVIVLDHVERPSAN
jgi:uncharacterized protein (TIGR03435 family)